MKHSIKFILVAIFLFSLTPLVFSEHIKITSLSPENDLISITAGESQSFSINNIDTDMSDLTYSWVLNGDEVSNALSYTYESNSSSIGQHYLKVKVSNGMSEEYAQMMWHIAVQPDSAPELTSFAPESYYQCMLVGDSRTFSVDSPEAIASGV